MFFMDLGEVRLCFCAN